MIRRVLDGHLVRRRGLAPAAVQDFLGFHDHAANFPWQSHALWYYSQMVRWGQTAHSAEKSDLARRVYRPDIFRSAMTGIGVDLPNASSKVEGALTVPTPVASSLGKVVLGPDGFFDGVPFDPSDLTGYLGRFGAKI
jgi:NitT/TauT family transport system ATP-binding protein